MLNVDRRLRLSHLLMRKLERKYKTKCKTNVQTSYESNVGCCHNKLKVINNIMGILSSIYLL